MATRREPIKNMQRVKECEVYLFLSPTDDQRERLLVGDIVPYGCKDHGYEYLCLDYVVECGTIEHVTNLQEVLDIAMDEEHPWYEQNLEGWVREDKMRVAVGGPPWWVEFPIRPLRPGDVICHNRAECGYIVLQDRTLRPVLLSECN